MHFVLFCRVPLFCRSIYCSTLQCVGVTDYTELFPEIDTVESDINNYTKDAVLNAYAGFLVWFQNVSLDDVFHNLEEQFSALKNGSLKWPVPFKHDN